ncbi:MAG: hypothetical protein ABI668_05630 [Sphingorhabdus sp.]
MSDNDPPKDEKLPSIEEMLQTISEQDADLPLRWEAKYREIFSQSEMQGQIEYEHLKGLRDHYRHKSRWSWFLMAVMGAMIAFQMLLLKYVGLGVWDFTEYEWLLPVLLVQNLAQVIGLAVFVVKALFKDVRKGD